MPSSRILTTSALLGGVLLQTPAFAAPPDSPQALFDRGIEDMEAGRYDKGCPAIEQSYKLDPLPGTLFALAECEAKWGHAAAAVTHYDAYLALYPTLPHDKKLRQGDREKMARAQRLALEPKVAELTLVLPPGTPTGTRVTWDGAPITTLGVPIIVDPGEHVATTQSPGGPVTETHITLAKGEKKGVALDVRGAASATTGGQAAAPPPPPVGTGPNKAVLIAGGVIAGAAAVAGAAMAGLYASKGSDAKSKADQVRATVPGLCPPASSNPTGLCGDLKADLDAKATFGTTSVALFATAGAVGIATLVYGLAGGSRAGSAFVVSPVVTGEARGLFVMGSF